MRNLNDMVPSGWLISTAWDINNAGQIVASGSFAGGVQHALPEQIYLGSTVHLAFQHFETVDLGNRRFCRRCTRAVILGMPLMGWLLQGVVPDRVASYLGLALAVLLGLWSLVLLKGARPAIAGFRDRRTWNLLVLAVGVKLFGGRAVNALELPGMPHLSSGISWPYGDTTVLATPNIRADKVTVIDTRTWRVIKEIPTLGPGFFMRSHENSPYAWVDVFFGKEREVMHVIDKRKL